MDKVSRLVRSGIMKKVKGYDTSTEIIYRKALWKSGVRGWRCHPKNVTGHPDIVFRRFKLAIFIDGCFWHGCPSCYRRPKSSQKYWDSKLKKNIKRDRKVELELSSSGWSFIRFWEHDIKNDLDGCIKKTNIIIRKCCQ